MTSGSDSAVRDLCVSMQAEIDELQSLLKSTDQSSILQYFIDQTKLKEKLTAEKASKIDELVQVGKLGQEEIEMVKKTIETTPNL
jgi:hypothetical protein